VAGAHSCAGGLSVPAIANLARSLIQYPLLLAPSHGSPTAVSIPEPNEEMTDEAPDQNPRVEARIPCIFKPDLVGLPHHGTLRRHGSRRGG